jgi:alpha-mannosidase
MSTDRRKFGRANAWDWRQAQPDSPSANMVPENPFLQLTLPRVTQALARVQASIWHEVAPVPVSFGGTSASHVDLYAARDRLYRKVELPFHWGRLFDQGWFRLDLPPAASTTPLYLHWQDQGEGTAYIDGLPYYGFDVAHRYCPLPPDAREVFIEGLCLQSAIWHPAATGLDTEGSRLTRAAVMRRDDLAWQVYHDLLVLYDVALEEAKTCQPVQPRELTGIGYHPPIESVPVLYRRLLRALDDAVNALDRGGLTAAREVLAASYQRFAGQHERIQATLTGHAHIDLVWMWPERVGEYKAVHTFSSMNRLLDTYPEMVFGYSQPASFDAVARRCPPLMQSVQERLGQGSWEALGAMQVESDTLLPCGEALARSFLIGQEGFNRIQGRPSPVCWLPDVFGYSGCLPQIMRQTGVDYFFTTKLTWSNITPFPHSSFRWRGADGSEVLVHVTQENGYVQTASPEELRRGARAYRQSDVHDEFLAPTGYGDGGGGVTEEMCERARRSRSLAGMPETRWGRVEEFFDRLQAVRARLPVYQGELYLEYHRGVFTTHGGLKATFRACERALQTREAVRCATGAGELEDGPWQRLIFAQFHDYIPGTSIWEVYAEGLPELQAITAQAQSEATRELSATPGAAALFNPLAGERFELLRDGRGRAVRGVTLPPVAGVIIDSLPSVEAASPVQATAQGLDSHSVSVRFDEAGQISRLTFGGCEIPARSALGELVLYADVPHRFDAWDIDRQTLNLGRPVDSAVTEIAAVGGELEGSVAFHRALGTASEVLVRYRLDAFEPILHIEYEIDWHEEQTLLKVLFPSGYAGRLARFGAPFGSVLRGQQAGSTQDEACFEAAGSRWAVISDDGEQEGLGVVAEAKYGWSCRDGTLGLSLLRAAHVTGSDAPHTRLFPNELRRLADGPDGTLPTFSDQGRHVIRLALCLHAPREAMHRNAAQLADTLFTPPLRYDGAAVAAGFAGLDGAPTLVPCWAKPARDGHGWILRLHETFGQRGRATLRLSPGFHASRTDLSEGSSGAISGLEIPFAPYELISLRIVREAT